MGNVDEVDRTLAFGAEPVTWIAGLPFTAGPAEVIADAPSVAWRTGTGFVAWPLET